MSITLHSSLEPASRAGIQELAGRTYEIWLSQHVQLHLIPQSCLGPTQQKVLGTMRREQWRRLYTVDGRNGILVG